MKIYLIGMPGSGKTTLAEAVASALLIPFVDLDHEIENREQKSIPEIFAQKGEPYFRQIESEILMEWAASDKDFVMATGGGAPCFFDGIDTINKSGISFFIDVPLETLVDRVREKSNRPLLEKSKSENDLRDTLHTLRNSRLSVYNQATITLKNPTVSSLLEKIRSRN